MSEPETVIRPSGKITTGSPAATSLISSRAASGLVGSMVWCRIILRNGLAHHALEMPVSTAKLASIGSVACSRGPSIRLTWLGAISMRVPRGGRFSNPRTSVRNRALNNSAPKSRTPSLPHLLSTNQTAPKLATARPKKIQEIARPAPCNSAMKSEPTTMKAPCNTLPAAMTRARSDREDREAKRPATLGPANDVLDQRGEERKHDRADQPEPRYDDHAVPKTRFGVKGLQQADRRRPRIGRDGEVRRGRRSRGNARGKCP